MQRFFIKLLDFILEIIIFILKCLIKPRWSIVDLLFFTFGMVLTMVILSNIK